MPKRIEAAVFDVDGMLLDTKEFIYQAYEHSLATHGHSVPPRKAIAELVGRSIQEAYKTFAPDGDLDKLFNTHDLFQAEKLDLIVAYDGLHEMLESLKRAGLKIGAFSSRYHNLIPSLEHVGVLGYFDAIVQGDEVINHKPDPEGLHLVLSKLNVPPAYASMSGDAAVDILAGQAAEVALTIGITHGFGTLEALNKVQPTHIVDHLDEIPPILISYVSSTAR